MSTFRSALRPAARLFERSPALRSPINRSPIQTTLQNSPFTSLSIRSRPLRSLRPIQRHTPKQTNHHLHHTPRRRPYSTQPTPGPSQPPIEPTRTLSQRLKNLSREYGWSAVGVYLLLSALDFPFCFLAVRWIGTEKIGQWEHTVVTWARNAIPVQIPEKYRFWKTENAIAEAVADVEVEVVDQGMRAGYDHGVREAEEANQGDGASKFFLSLAFSDGALTPFSCIESVNAACAIGLGTQLALAYAIHKSFIFIRVPATAAVLPKVVKTLRSWGWNIGRRKPKMPAEGSS